MRKGDYGRELFAGVFLSASRFYPTALEEFID
jgi:hypothetical protein